MKVVKLTESDLVRIVERVISEQTQNNVEQAFQLFWPQLSTAGTDEQKIIDAFKLLKSKQDFLDFEKKWATLKKDKNATIAQALNDELGIGDVETARKIMNMLFRLGIKMTFNRKGNDIVSNSIKIVADEPVLNTDPSLTQTNTSSSQTNTSSPQEEKTPFQWKQAPTAEEVQSGKKLLRYGMMGDFVGVVQEKLKSLGSNPGTIDKKFGRNTLRAVKDFQKKSGLGLKDDGLVGKKTYAALFEVKPQAQPEQPNVATGEKTNVQPEQPNLTSAENTNIQPRQINLNTAAPRGQVRRAVTGPPTAATQTTSTIPEDNF